MEIRFIEPEEWGEVEDFVRAHCLGPLHPQFVKVVVAVDEGRIVGLVVAQMVVHAEPIFVDPDYRNGRVALQLAEAMDAYLTTVGAYGVYNQPTNPTAEKLVARMGYTKCEHPLYVKVYRPLEELWPQQSPPRSE